MGEQIYVLILQWFFLGYASNQFASLEAISENFYSSTVNDATSGNHFEQVTKNTEFKTILES